MRIVLATPPEFRRFSTPAQVLGPPIGIMYIASYARSNGYLRNSNSTIEILDAFTKHIDCDGFVREIIGMKPDLLGISVTSRMFLATINTLWRIRKALPKMVIVLGGIHPSFMARNIVETFHFIDFVLKGEAERTFSELIVAIANNDTNLTRIKGITALRGGHFIDNEPDVISDLNVLPIPARDLVENIRYGCTWNGIDLTYGKFTSIVTSRGCPFTCNFCTNWAFSNRKLRIRSIENVADELEVLQNQGYKSCVIIDDIFTVDKKRVVNLCDEIRKRKIKLVLYCEGRVDSSDLDMFKNMKEAGFSSILFGIESGSQKVLDFYHKQITPSQTREAVRNAKQAKLHPVGAFIIGCPIEKSEDILQTLRHIAELDLDGIEVNALGIAPWDILFSKAEYEGKTKRTDWMCDHLISDFYDNLTKEELAYWVEQAYYSFFRVGYKSNMRKIIRYIRSSPDARNAFFRNILNPYSWQLTKEHGKPRQKIEEITSIQSETILKETKSKILNSIW